MSGNNRNRRGAGGVGMAVGAAFAAVLAATPGVASADSSTDPFSLIDELPSGLSVPAQTSPLDTQVMGATGLANPTSDAEYWQAAEAYAQAEWPGGDPVGLTTPEDLWPFTGTSTFDQSVSQGVADLNVAITPDLDAGTAVGVVGVSQSAVIASLEMEQLDPSGAPSDLPAAFVLLGDPMNPDGGLFERFPGLDIFGATFSGATPADDFPTAVYTHEYDPLSDFCAYPIDGLCDLNAILGVGDHSYTAADLSTAFELPTTGATETTYYMIPAELPLIEAIQDIPVVGTLLADLLGPDLSALVNFGYGDPDFGYSLDPANIPTPAELLPPVSDFQELLPALTTGTEVGIENFLAAI
jgi:hypothetical protein